MKKILLPFLLLIPFFVQSQTNVRAWYADGQVWVVWEAGFPLPDWYEIYAKPTAFNSTTNATRVGKIHLFEYACAALKEQVDTSITPRIPGPAGIGKYQLAANEGLFVFTPHQAGALFFAVVADGETVVNGQNITPATVPFQYNPVADPVECHLQATFPSPFANGYVCFAYLMWADGRQNQWDNRPDFPVMANAAKNGMPSLFFVSAPIGLDTTQPFPLSVWLHGGGGTARQSLAGSRAEVNIRPVEGILASHNDDVFGWRGMNPPGLENPTWHFGYRKNYDPFNSGNIPSTPDTIVNYTQRRYLWVDNWLIRNFNVDPNRIHIHGHSMGSAGALALAKCYPEHYASVTLFNTGCGGPEPGSML
ncbi:MAG: alpha/beta hydrolase-fold protein, partial [Saprospiraceae bacterium]|nr:alpha/beta hydrolase-fold protein [Saprospiraceae bacterium]